MIFSYAADGTRQPFDPRSTGANMPGCLLCGHPRITIVGIFVPATEEMRAVVVRLRQRALRSASTSAVAYGLCAQCVHDADVLDHVEAALVKAAARVTVQ